MKIGPALIIISWYIAVLYILYTIQSDLTIMKNKMNNENENQRNERCDNKFKG